MTADPLEFLRAAHAEAQARAEAATPGPWTAFEYVDHDCGFEATIGTGTGVHDRTSVVGHGYEGGGVERMADARHIAASDPAAALRRITAERKILALHAVVPDHGRFSEDGCDPHYCDGNHDEPPVCRSCRNYAGDPEEAPCRTIEILAEGYGWSR